MFQQEERTVKPHEVRKFLKFMRLRRINPVLRLHIASMALCHWGEYGIITTLAQKYGISRTFVYQLRTQLLLCGSVVFGVFGQEVALDLPQAISEEVEEKLLVIREILALRLEGRCSITSISLLLTRRNLGPNSVGYISELLNEIGKQLSPVLEEGGLLRIAVVLASDEIFAKGRPILITVDPVSSAILRMEIGADRSGETWAAHWQSLLDAGYIPVLLTNDEGSGMQKGAQLALEDVTRQSDTYHGVAHRLGGIRRILEQKAYKAIGAEYERQGVLASARSEEVIQKRQAAYEAAKAHSEVCIDLYDAFCACYERMLAQFVLFDEQGELRCVDKSKAAFLQAIADMQALGHPKANEQLQRIRGLVPVLFIFFQRAQQVVEQLGQDCLDSTQKQALPFICLAFQHQKGYRKAKTGKAKAYHRQNEEEQLFLAQIVLDTTPQKAEAFINHCYEQLATIVQASSLVETINSIVRMYLNNSKNQLNQAQLNLIMFYHNHRRYTQGIRQGSTPMELLTGQSQQKDWLDLLMDKIYKKTASDATIKTMATQTPPLVSIAPKKARA